MTYRLEVNKPKGTCLACRTPGKFRFFEDLTTGIRLPPEFGRCDRENSCGYFRAPNARDPIENPEPKVVDLADVKATLDKASKNHFYTYLETLFGTSQAEELVQKYQVGTAKNRKTVFWYIDQQGFPRNAKVYLYKSDGRRDKSHEPRYQFTKKNGFCVPIYGSHLVNQAKLSGNRKIAVVESEKSAVIASSQFKDVLWLASGGANMLTAERCNSLAYYSRQLNGAHIHLFADADDAGRKGFLKAEDLLLSMKAPVLYHDLFKDRNDGWDVADEILNTISESVY